MIRRHSHTLPNDTALMENVRKENKKTGVTTMPKTPSKVRRRALWIQGTCLANRNWFLQKADRMGHEATGRTVWDAFLKPGTI